MGDLLCILSVSIMKCLCFFSWLVQARMIPGLLFTLIVPSFLAAQPAWQAASAPASVCFRSGLSIHGEIYAGTDGVGVYRRVSPGQWIAEAPSDSMGVIRALLEHGNKLFALGSDALWKRLSNGNWLKVLALTDEESELLSICSHGESLCVGWSYGLFQSDDTGRHWKEAGGQLEGKAITSLASWGHALWAESEGSVFRSTDDGMVWYPETEGLPAGSRELAFKVAADSLYLLDAQNGLYCYTDGSWFRHAIAGGVRALVSYKDDLYAAGSGGVYKRIDRDGSWIPLTGFAPGIQAATVLLAAPDGLLLGTNHQGCWRLPDSAAFPVEEETRIPNTRISSLTAINGTLCMTTRFAGTLHLSVDSGRHWQSGFRSAFPQADATVFRADGALQWLGTSSGLWCSRDAGANWQVVPLFSRQRIHDILQVEDGWLVAGMAGTVFKTGDEGRSWQFAGNGFQRPGVYQLLKMGDAVFAATYGGLYKSRNGGSEWVKVDSGLPAWEAAAHIALIDGLLYLSTFESGLFVSYDSGRSFEWLHQQFSEWSLAKIVGSGSQLFATDGLKVFVSNDRGRNWSPFMNGLPYKTRVSDLCLFGRSCWAATEGKGLWRLNAAGLSVQTPGRSAEPATVRLWPSPCADQLHIQLPEAGAWCEILDFSGRAVWTKYLTEQEAVIDVSGFPAASYLLRWHSMSAAGARRFLKQ